MNIYIQSCFGIKTLDIIFITDLDFSNFELPENVKIVSMRLEDVIARVYNATGITPNIHKPYKLCDIRPLYGKIFEDIFAPYEYWGWGDCDLVYGNIDKFLQKINYTQYDVISLRKYWTTGSFSLFKNIECLRNLGVENPDLKEILTTPENLCNDEAGGHWHELAAGRSLAELEVGVKSFTSMVSERGLKWYHEDIIKERLYRFQYLKKNKNGIFYSDGKECFICHFVVLKKTFIFKLPHWDVVPEEYLIDRTGLYVEYSMLRKVKTFFEICRYEAYRLVQKTYRLFRYGKWY